MASSNAEGEPGTDRVAALEKLLRWEGELDNARIRQFLGVKPVWASRLLAELMQRLGSRITRSLKRGPIEWVSPETQPDPRESPDEYLALLASANGESATWPCVHDARIDLTAVHPAVFAAVLKAARSGTGVRIFYRSMSTPAGASRVVFPHALIRAPRRWHMRAWCVDRGEFRDFVLSRVQSAESVEAPAPDGAAPRRDDGWTRMVDLRLIPHPGLSEQQQRLIAAEMFPGARAKRLRVRECLATYVLQDLRVALDVKRDTPPEFQLALASTADVAHLWGSTSKSK